MPFSIVNKISGWFSHQDKAEEEEAKRAAWREQQANGSLNLALTKRLLQMRDQREQLDKAKETPALTPSVSTLPVPVKKTKVSKLSAAWSKKTLLRPYPKLQPFFPQTPAADISAARVHVHRESTRVDPASACEPIDICHKQSVPEAGSGTSSLSLSHLSSSSGGQQSLCNSSAERPTATPLTSVQDAASEAYDALKKTSNSSLDDPAAS